jgi:LmbE family N-acetylglucosaminyl deacetylase
MFNRYKKILILAPHTDDGELGLGGTIAKFTEEGKEVYYLAFSSAEISIPEGYPKDVLVKEVKKATKKLGILPENLILLNYPTRTFNEHRQEILSDMIKYGKKIEPDLVFLPSRFDTHQDHVVIHDEALRAFKKVSMFGYECPWNNFTFETTAFSKLDDKHIGKKIDAIKGYQSQSHRYFMSPEFTTGLAHIRGAQVNYKNAESFEVIRIIF